MANEKTKIKILARLSYQEFPYVEMVNKCYPGVPVVGTPDGWVLFRSIDDYFKYQKLG